MDTRITVLGITIAIATFATLRDHHGTHATAFESTIRHDTIQSDMIFLQVLKTDALPA